MGGPRLKAPPPCPMGQDRARTQTQVSVQCPFHWVTWLWPHVCLPSIPGTGSPHPEEIGVPTFHLLSIGAGGVGALGGVGVPGGVAGESKAQDRLGREEDWPVEIPPPNLSSFCVPRSRA